MCARLARAAAPLCCMRATFRCCVRVSSLLCACFIAVVCVFHRCCVRDSSLLCAWLSTLVCTTLYSYARDSSFLCEWLFELVCVTFHILVRDFFWRVREFSPVRSGLIYPYEFNRETFNLSTQIRCRGHIFFTFFGFFHLLCDGWCSVQDRSQYSWYGSRWFRLRNYIRNSPTSV